MPSIDQLTATASMPVSSETTDVLSKDEKVLSLVNETREKLEPQKINISYHGDKMVLTLIQYGSAIAEMDFDHKDVNMAFDKMTKIFQWETKDMPPVYYLLQK